MVLKDGVSLYEVSINRLSGVETYPYSQRIDVSIGVRDNTIAYVWLTIAFDNNPSPDSPEWAFASPRTIFNRYGVPDQFRTSVRSTEAGIASTITAYWQSSGLLIVYGLELYPYDQNGSTLQLCLTPDRSTSIYLVKTLPGTGESEIGTITGPLLRLRAPLTADMFLEAPNIAGVIGKLISGECLKTLDSYWFSLDPSYPTVTPWATDTPRPVATNAPTKTPTATDIPTTISTAIRHNLRIILYNRHRAGCDFPVGEKCCQQNRNILIQ
jgi:hypothetical protein